MIKIAIRNTIRNKKNSIILIIIFISVIFSLLFLKGIVNSAPIQSESSYIACIGDINVSLFEGYFDLKLIDKITKDKTVEKIYTYNKIYNAYFDSIKGSDTLSIIGFDFDKEPEIKSKWIIMDSGRLTNSDSLDEIVIDQFYKYSLNLKIGDNIIVSCFNKNGIINSMEFKIVGFVSYSFERNFISEKAMQLLIGGYCFNIVKIYCKNKDEKNILNLQDDIKRFIKSNYDIEEKKIFFNNIIDYKRNSMKTFLSFFTGIMLIFFIIIFFISGILIGLSNYLDVIRRTKEIGTYISLGFNQIKIIWIFFIEKFLLLSISYMISLILFLIISYYLSIKKLFVSFGSFLVGYLYSIPKIEDFIIIFSFIFINCFIWILISTHIIYTKEPIKALHSV